VAGDLEETAKTVFGRLVHIDEADEDLRLLQRGEPPTPDEWAALRCVQFTQPNSEWRSGEGTSVQIGSVNRHGQICTGRCDVLIHESYGMKTYNAVSADAQASPRRLHTSTMQLAELAGKAKPGLLILYHRSNLGGVLGEVPNPEEAFLEEIRSGYAGNVVVGHDLDIF
jgi:hypothetical protein